MQDLRQSISGLICCHVCVKLRIVMNKKNGYLDDSRLV
jgi:hypothetical protein